MTACYQEYGGQKSTVDDALTRMVDGIFVGLDDDLFKQCERIAQNKVIEICGSVSECQAFSKDDFIGTESLIAYKNGDGNYVIDGLINFGGLTTVQEIGENNTLERKFNITEYLEKIAKADEATRQRIQGSLETVQSKIEQLISRLKTDHQISMCISGRDISQLSKHSQSIAKKNSSNGRTNARYPNLLDTYQLMIINSGTDQAFHNYSKKLNTLFGEATENKNDDEKAAICAAVVGGNSVPRCVEYAAGNNGQSVCTKFEATNPFDNVMSGNGDFGIITSSGGTRLVIEGAKTNAKINAMTSGTKQYIQTDSEGNMLGTIDVNAVYSAQTNTCIKTTTTTMCKDMEQIITTETTKCGTGLNVAGGCNGGGGVVQVGYWNNTTKEEFKGVSCKEFGEPVITRDEIKM